VCLQCTVLIAPGCFRAVRALPGEHQGLRQEQQRPTRPAGSRGVPAYPVPWGEPVMPTHVLFVCLGNICRSPLAEAVFRAKIAEAGLADAFAVDSAGTGSWHVGEPPDERTRRVARARGIELARTARQIRRDELDRWDYIVVMDESNRRDVLSLGADPARVVKLRDFDPEGPGDVPDPYYGGLDAFEQVYGIIDRSLDGFLEALRPSLDPGTGL